MGTLRARVDDFFVDEVVPDRIAQEGEHLHVRIEKRGISTEEAVRRMAKSFGVAPRSVGRCGRKDVRAVTRQWFSFTGVKEHQVDALELADLQVLEHVRLPRKLRMGRFLGNRFRIRVRDLAPAQMSRAEQGLARVARRGLSNAFGEQRLGRDGLNARIGRYLILDQLQQALALHVENNRGHDVERMRQHLAGGRAQDALRVLGRRRAGFLISAWQADVFNRVLEGRGELFDQALAGDVFQQHSSGRLLSIDDAREAAERVESFECSATGPLPGPDMPGVSGAALEIEAAILTEDVGGDPTRRRWYGCTGTRRPFRVPVTEAVLSTAEDDMGCYLELFFRLPPGAFATTVVQDILS